MLLLPTGQWAHRVFLVGSLVDIVDDPDSENYIRGELQDPTGRFPIDAGQFEPEAIANMRQLDPPEFVAVTGKAVTFAGDSGPVPKVRVENITVIPEALYDSWVKTPQRRRPPDSRTSATTPTRQLLSQQSDTGPTSSSTAMQRSKQQRMSKTSSARRWQTPSPTRMRPPPLLAWGRTRSTELQHPR